MDAMSDWYVAEATPVVVAGSGTPDEVVAAAVVMVVAPVMVEAEAGFLAPSDNLLSSFRRSLCSLSNNCCFSVDFWMS